MKTSLRRKVLALGFAVSLVPGLAPGGAAKAQGVSRRVLAGAEGYTGDTFRHFGETPRGASVVARVRPRPEALRAIDEGLTELFAAARRNGYRSRLNHGDYTVVIARADRTRNSSGAYSPDIDVDVSYYAGSRYDRGGRMWVAGMVSSYSPAVIIVAEHERDFRRMADVVRYEGEHLILYHNDRARFRATADHSRGGAHPILN